MQAHLKQMIKTPGVKLGSFIAEFATPGIGHILKAGGCDFAFLDMEHTGFSFETIKNAIRYFEAAGVSVIVRVPA
jgi:2-keto-3-deoxy-L-rhamnonate aldolase RhmA